MADPGTLGALSLAGSVAGTGMNLFGALSEGKSKSEMYQYQAGIAEFNQKIALQNRDYALTAGDKEAGRYGLKAQQQAGTIKAQQGASGVSVNSGSAVEVQTSAHDIAKMDMATIRNNAARTAYGYSVQATQYGAQSSMYKAAARDARSASFLKAAGSLISGATSVSDKWLQGKQYGLFGKSHPVDVGYATSYGD